MLHGILTYVRGVSWFTSRPLSIIILIIPFLIGCTTVFGAYSLFQTYESQIYTQILFEPSDTFLSKGLFFISKIAVQFGLYVFVALSGLLVANIASAPIYEYLSVQVEKSIVGETKEALSLWSAILLIPEEIKKLSFILSVSILILLLPGVNVISPIVTVFLLGWDFFDYPLARRGLSFKERKSLAFKSKWHILGLGLWLLIPFVQIILLPMAVSGGTMLGLEALQKK